MVKHPRVEFAGFKHSIDRSYQDLVRHHTFQVSAALSYWFVLSVFPGLILLAALLGFVPFPDLFNHVLALIRRLLPVDSMRIVNSVLGDVLSSHHGTWFSFGLLGTIWTASSAFDAMIEALNIAYEVEDDRPYWKTRLLAIGLAAITGGLLLVAMIVTIVGPHFGFWLADQLSLSSTFAMLWPVLRGTIAIVFTILAVEVLYYLAPNVKKRFAATLPGAALSVGVWNVLTLLLGVYFRHFAHFNRTYGAIGGLIAMMGGLYWASWILLVGAEINGELGKERKKSSEVLRDHDLEGHRIVDRDAA